MASNTKSKSQSYVESIAWGSASPTMTITNNPVKTVWTATSTSAFQISVSHSNSDGDQGFSGKTITVTLCDGTYTFQTSD